MKKMSEIKSRRAALLKKKSLVKKKSVIRKKPSWHCNVMKTELEIAK